MFNKWLNNFSSLFQALDACTGVLNYVCNPCRLIPPSQDSIFAQSLVGTRYIAGRSKCLAYLMPLSIPEYVCLSTTYKCIHPPPHNLPVLLCVYTYPHAYRK